MALVFWMRPKPGSCSTASQQFQQSFFHAKWSKNWAKPRQRQHFCRQAWQEGKKREQGELLPSKIEGMPAEHYSHQQGHVVVPNHPHLVFIILIIIVFAAAAPQ